MRSKRYTFIYATVISVITAVLLAFSAEGLKPFQDANVAFEKKSNILSAVRVSSPDRALIEKTYADQVKELVLDGKGTELSGVSPNDVVLKEEVAKQPEARQLPLYVYTGEGGRKYYIIPMQGVGFWGPIWGYVSLEDDFNTVYGAFFDHKSETPGLCAEISEKPFQEQFQGKKIMDAQNNFISVHELKKAAKVNVGAEHRVDGISGGTITSRGTDNMLKNCVAPYLTYFGKMINDK